MGLCKPSIQENALFEKSFQLKGMVIFYSFDPKGLFEHDGIRIDMEWFLLIDSIDI
jgi:hypothetical protein